MTQSTELIELPADLDSQLTVFTNTEKLAEYYAIVENHVAGVVHDTSTKKGRDQCASDAYKVTRTKTAVSKVGAELSAHYKEIPKKIDAGRRWWNDKMDELRDKVRAPLDAWEAQEATRIKEHQEALEAVRVLTANLDGRTSESLASLLAAAQAVELGEKWEEFEVEAAREKDKAISVLTQALATQQKAEKEQAELAEFRRKQAEQEQKDREARIAQEAAEKARAEAEAKAQAERDAAAKREAEAKAAAEKAERDRLDAIERQKQAEARVEAEKLAAEQRAKDAAEAARLAEIKRQADAAAAEEAARKKREANIAHKAAINNAALAAFIENGLPEECAKQAVILIARGVIPAIRIFY